MTRPLIPAFTEEGLLYRRLQALRRNDEWAWLDDLDESPDP
jgi:hypothetical protein